MWPNVIETCPINPAFCKAYSLPDFASLAQNLSCHSQRGSGKCICRWQYLRVFFNSG